MSTNPVDQSVLDSAQPAAASSQATRRSVIAGSVAVVGAGGLAACGSAASPNTTPTSSETSSGTSSSAATTSSAPATSTSNAAAAGGIPTSEIPVGGGKIFTDKQVVITQPKSGEFKAFNTACTHEGCPVTQIAGTNIVCPCHGSTFDTTTGDPTGGPAQSALAAVQITVAGDSITIA